MCTTTTSKTTSGKLLRSTCAAGPRSVSQWHRSQSASPCCWFLGTVSGFPPPSVGPLDPVWPGPRRSRGRPGSAAGYRRAGAVPPPSLRAPPSLQTSVPNATTTSTHAAAGGTRASLTETTSGSTHQPCFFLRRKNFIERVTEGNI